MTCRRLRSAIPALVLTVCGLAAQAASHIDVLIVDLQVNGKQLGDVFVLQDETGGFYVEASLLDQLQIIRPYPDGVEYRGQAYHPLRGFAGASVEYDTLNMSLQVVLPPSLMRLQTLAMYKNVSPAPSSAAGMYADYDINYQRQARLGYQNLSGLMRANLFGPPGSVSTSILYRSVSNDGPAEIGAGSNGINVLDLTYTRDDPENLRSLRVGDVISEPGSVGRSLRFGGVQFGTNFATQPMLITYPLPSFYGEAAVPTALDIYVNGQLRHRQEVAPGPYVLEDVPVINGAGQLQVVANDALGRQQVFVQDFYLAPSLLKEGLNDYSFGLGALREEYGLENFRYGDVVGSATWRHGVSNYLTVDAHGEFGGGTTMVGGGSQYLVTAGGILNTGLGLSTGNKGTGAQWLLGFEQNRDVFSYRLRLAGTTQEFATVGQIGPLPQLQLFANTGFTLPERGAIGVALSHEKFRQKADRTVASLTFSTNLAGRLSLSAFISYIDTDTSEFSAGVRFALPIGEQHSASGGVSRTEIGTVAQAEFLRNLPPGRGYGYRVAAQTGGNRINAGLIAQNDFASYTLDIHDSDAGGSGWQLGTQGSIAHLDGMTRATRQIRDAFAVVNVGNYEGVRVYFENQEIGRTDGNGQVFIPGLRPYLRNQIRIEPTDLPLSARIEDLGTEIAPYYRSGVIVNFNVRDAHDAVLRLVLPDGTPLREGAIATMMGRQDYSPIGSNGRVYLQGIERPSQVTIRWNGSVCDIIVPKPEGSDVLPDLGEFVCVPRDFE
ncbi:MAG: fimbria/pilus outer membrane usher protein [Gammaproteobacteria bacterium]|nr:fimbria/pilus outer membrane usher protein [Gammaproteobacteria bacterium]MDH4255356.1 fimbria/pilus outer membrane usher protein [Gammaproteobacteria bacterium]MDH5310904.1 fimbria/pilus outer membrane usher protein [Gammaproteobacteria bacterium]